MSLKLTKKKKKIAINTLNSNCDSRLEAQGCKYTGRYKKMESSIKDGNSNGEEGAYKDYDFG